MKALYCEVYQHEDFGEMEVCWAGPDRARLVSLQAGLFVPAEEVEALLEWAQNLQHDDVTRGGDAVTPHHH